MSAILGAFNMLSTSIYAYQLPLIISSNKPAYLYYLFLKLSSTPRDTFSPTSVLLHWC